MTDGHGGRLPCGAESRALVEYAAEGAKAPAGSHEAGVGTAGGAQGVRRAMAPRAAVVGTEDEVPRRFVATVMSRVRRIVESPRHAVSASGRGVTMVTSWALGLMAATATEDTPE